MFVDGNNIYYDSKNPEDREKYLEFAAKLYDEGGKPHIIEDNRYNYEIDKTAAQNFFSGAYVGGLVSMAFGLIAGMVSAYKADKKYNK